MSPPFITFPQLNFIIKKSGVTYQKSKTVVQSLTDFHNNEVATNPNESATRTMRTAAIVYQDTGMILVGHSNFSTNSYLGKIWKSTNSGSTWTRTSDIPVRVIQGVRNFGVGGQTVIATCAGAAGNADIYRSTNSGGSFSRTYNSGNEAIYDNGTGIVGSTMVVGGGYGNGSGGILRWTIDTGATWRNQNPTTTSYTRVVSPTYAGINGGNQVWLALAHASTVNNYELIMSNQTLDSTTLYTWGNSWALSPNQPFANVQQRLEWIGGNTVLSFSYTDPIQIRTTSNYFSTSTVVQTLPAGLNNVRKLINFGSGKLWILCHGAAGTGVIYESTDSGSTWNVSSPIQAFPDMNVPFDMTLNVDTGSVYVIGNYISTHPTNANRALLYEISP